MFHFTIFILEIIRVKPSLVLVVADCKGCRLCWLPVVVAVRSPVALATSYGGWYLLIYR